MKILYYLIFLTPIILGCSKSENTFPDLDVRYVEDICCGNLIILDKKTIDSYSSNYADSLLYSVNLSQYINSLNLEFGDELDIEYELLSDPVPDEYQYNCPALCNRHHGIPIKIISLDKR